MTDEKPFEFTFGFDGWDKDQQDKKTELNLSIRIDRKRKTIDFITSDSKEFYSIEISRLKEFNWVKHLQEKDWMTDHLMRKFRLAIKNI